MTAKIPHLRTAALNRAIDNLLPQFSPGNSQFMHNAIRYKRNKGLKAGSIRSFANCMMKADQLLKGKPFGEASVDDLASIIEGLRKQQFSERYLALISIHLRAGWKRVLGVRELPRPIFEALEVREPKGVVKGLVVPDDAFNALLEAAAKMDGEVSTLHRAPMLVALLWVLRSTGFRISEALSLKFGDVHFDESGADLRLDESEEQLKTGPRNVWDQRSIPALRAWMDMHPTPGDPAMPVFIGLRNRDGSARLRYLTFQRILERLSNETGLTARFGSAVTPHDFRHTRATEIARNREMGEEQMRGYLGWSSASKMPGIYIHLTSKDQKNAVMRAANITPTGYATAKTDVGASPEDLALLRKLKRLLAD